MAADEGEADLIVIGAQLRVYGGQPFLGHGVEWLLEYSHQTVVVVVLPLAEGESATAPAATTADDAEDDSGVTAGARVGSAAG
jgi:hypothetical protein